MKSLALGLVFFAFVSLSDSACSITLLKSGETHCVDVYNNSEHPMGSTWTNHKCVKCTCFPGKMKCCNTMDRATPVTRGCTVKYHYETCTFEVFHPKDSTVKCLYRVFKNIYTA
ncbi:hypothetical protein Q8A67_010426 [Cirrhinus molitorella]|uniref:Beta-microseminoprotein n=1 Tax=Cirrhinus molitorella TaxID=172907 RepID=A0AA88PTQ1_9TELE|nr:hypothetical protein Q8A67_010426 [Cirrhinus molitorella]